MADLPKRGGATPEQCAAFVRNLPVGGFGILVKSWTYKAPQVMGPEVGTELPVTHLTVRRVSFATYTVEFAGPLPEIAVQAIVRALATL